MLFGPVHVHVCACVFVCRHARALFKGVRQWTAQALPQTSCPVCLGQGRAPGWLLQAASFFCCHDTPARMTHAGTHDS